MYERRSKKGVLAVAFGVGLLLACFCPKQLLIPILAIAVILLGLCCIK